MKNFKKFQLIVSLILVLASSIAFKAYANGFGISFILIITFISLALIFSSTKALRYKKFKNCYLNKLSAFIFTICFTTVIRELLNFTFLNFSEKYLAVASLVIGFLVGFFSFSIIKLLSNKIITTPSK